MSDRFAYGPIRRILGLGTSKASAGREAADEKPPSGDSKYLETSSIGVDKRRIGQIVKAFLLAYLIINSFTFQVGFPGVGLDPSWHFALNHLVDSNLIFGKDVFFTYGPLGFVLGPMDIGSNILIAAICHLGAWILFAFLLVYGSYRRFFSVENLFLFAVSTIFYSWTLEYLLPGMVLILLLFQSHIKRWFPIFLLATLITVLLFFIKFDIALIAWSSLLAFSFLQIVTDRYRGIIQSGISMIIAPLFFTLAYYLYNPFLSDMIAYVKAAYEMSANYSLAMSLPGKWYEIYFALLFCTSYFYLSLQLYKSKQVSFLHSIAFIPALFIYFKHGFVRQDGHVLGFFIGAILIIGVLLLFYDLKTTNMRRIKYIYAVLVFICFFVCQQHFHTVLIDYVLPISSINRITHSVRSHTHDYKAFLKKAVLPEAIRAEIGRNKTGIFPSEVSYIVANDLDYSPFPVFQTFCAYTSYLDNLNADFLESGKAPPYLLMQFGVLDGRHCLVDGPSTWLSIYRWYEPRELTDSVLILRKRQTPRFEVLEPTGRAEYQKTERISIPECEEPLLVKISLDLSLTGRIAKTFYKILPVEMALTDEAGRVSIFRVTPDTLQNGLFLNYLPQDLYELKSVLNGTATGRICSFELLGEGLRMYRNSMSVQFTKIQGIKISHSSEDLSFPEGIRKSLHETTFNIDSIEHALSVKRGKKVVAGRVPFIHVKGWAVDDEAQDAGAGVWADIDGKLYPALRTLRDDVADRFNNPTYQNAGFSVGLPVFSLSPGSHQLSFKLLAKNKTYYYQSEPMVLEIPNR